MAFHESKPARNYVYTAYAPTLNADLVDEQLRRATTYRNNLVEVERNRRQRNQQIRSAMFPDLAALEQERDDINAAIDGVRAEMKAASARARAKVRDPERTALIKTLQAQRKETAIRLAALREQVNTDLGLKERWKASEDEAAAERRRLRGTCGLQWGSYLICEQTVKITGEEPRFRGYDGTGRMAVQIQITKPLLAEQLMDGYADTRVQLLPSPWGGNRCLLRFRIGSAGRAPVWTEIPIILSRPLPEGKMVKWVYLIAQRPSHRLPKRRWKVVFVLAATDDSAWDQKNTAPDNTHIAFDVNWRRVENGVRVATWRADDDTGGELVIPNRIIDIQNRVEEIQSERDIAFNIEKVVLGEYLRSKAGLLPDWLQTSAETLMQWRSQRRLAGLVSRWRSDRHPGDEGVFSRLEEWRKRDKHRYQHEERLRQRVQNWREWFYRTELLQLARRYQTAFVEKLNVAKMRRTPGPEKEDNVVVRYRNLASIGRLLQLIVKEYFTPLKVEAKGTTTLHLACGHDNTGIDKGPRFLHCEGCGAEFDQDENAAQVIMQRGLAELCAT